MKCALGDIFNYHLRVNASKVDALFWCLVHLFCAIAPYFKEIDA